MSSKLRSIFSGRLHLIEGEYFWASRGRFIYSSCDNGRNWKRIAVLRIPILSRLYSASKLARRLSRMYVNQIVRIDKNSLAIVGFGYVFFYSLSCNKVMSKYPIRGKRPLVVCAHEGRLIYGEYRGNFERGPISLISVDKNAGNKEIYTFSNIRHIHGVSCDPIDDSLWVTTGDNDDESAIWHFKTLGMRPRMVCGGSQKYRAVQLLFDSNYVYYGTDTPLEQNYICRIDRGSYRVEQLHLVGSSIFYGCTVNGRHVFGSVCEPSDVNEVSHITMYCSNGKDSYEWSAFLRLSKDFWSMRWFQYGQVFFPFGCNNSNQLYFTPMGVDGDQNTYKIQLPVKE